MALHGNHPPFDPSKLPGLPGLPGQLPSLGTNPRGLPLPPPQGQIGPSGPGGLGQLPSLPGIPGAPQPGGGGQPGGLKGLLSNPQFLQGLMMLAGGAIGGRHGGAAGQGVSDAFKLMRDIQDKKTEQQQLQERIGISGDLARAQIDASREATLLGREEFGAATDITDRAQARQALQDTLSGSDPALVSMEEFFEQNPGAEKHITKQTFKSLKSKAISETKLRDLVTTAAELELIERVAKIGKDAPIPQDIKDALGPEGTALLEAERARLRADESITESAKKIALAKAAVLILNQGTTAVSLVVSPEGEVTGTELLAEGQPTPGRAPNRLEQFVLAQEMVNRGLMTKEAMDRLFPGQKPTPQEFTMAQIVASGKGDADAKRFLELTFDDDDDRKIVDRAIQRTKDFIGAVKVDDAQASIRFINSVKALLIQQGRPDLAKKLGEISESNPGATFWTNNPTIVPVVPGRDPGPVVPGRDPGGIR